MSTTGTRIEHDLLGDLPVPADAYWGIHTQRAVENFQISARTINDAPEFIRGMVQVKKATAMANRDLGTIPGDVAKDIIAACDLILEEGRCMDQFPTDQYQGGAGTSVNMNTNEVVANLALELRGEPKGSYGIINPMDHVNASQSTNDAYPTGFRLALMYLLDGLEVAVAQLRDSFAAKGNEFAKVLKMGRTQLQDAVPMTLGQEFHAFADNMDEELETLAWTKDLLLEVNLGATAIGTGLNTPAEYTTTVVRHLGEVVGRKILPADNLIEATYDNGAYVHVHATVKRLAVKLSKICNDLRLLSSGPRAGLNEINLPELQAGSSIMPAKVNPVIPEVVNQVCFKVFGNDVTVTCAAEAGQLQLNVMEPVIARSCFESVRLLTNSCNSLRTKCVDGITANDEVTLQHVFSSIGLVTFLNPFIGHANGDKVGKICASTGKNVREVILELGLMEEAELDKVLSVDNLMHPRYTGPQYHNEVGES